LPEYFLNKNYLNFNETNNFFLREEGDFSFLQETASKFSNLQKFEFEFLKSFSFLGAEFPKKV